MMRRFYEPEMEKGETNFWMSVSNLLAAAMLVFFVVMIAVLAFFGVQTSQQSKTVDAAVSVEALEAREAGIAAREKALADSEAALKELAGTRSVIIRQLADKLSGLNLPIEIDNNTGNIRFTEAVLFDIDNYTLNSVGQQRLKDFVPAYLNVLLSSENKKYVDQIIVEGHADNDGDYMYNLDLSQKRANAVINFILGQNLAKLEDGTIADKYFTVSARSFNAPVQVNGKVDSSKSRRVEFVFRLKDDALLTQMQDLYKGER